jgi:hypothetical protein
MTAEETGLRPGVRCADEVGPAMRVEETGPYSRVSAGADEVGACDASRGVLAPGDRAAPRCPLARTTWGLGGVCPMRGAAGGRLAG